MALQKIFKFQELAKKGNISGTADLKGARQWFRDSAMGIRKMSIPKYQKDTGPFQNIEALSENSIGRMYNFMYDPKWKEELPYYDVFPLVFPLNLSGDRMLGLNLHYIAPYYRAILMDALWETANNDKFNKTTKLKISYDILNSASKYKYFKPCLKQYLFDHVQSPFININPKMYDYVLMLPQERFKKKSKDFVWLQSELQF